VKQTFAHVMADAQKSMEYCYARLFVQSPPLRALFPLAMDDLSGPGFSCPGRPDLLATADRGHHDPPAAAGAGGPPGFSC
jgi:hypothetical protein